MHIPYFANCLSGKNVHQSNDKRNESTPDVFHSRAKFFYSFNYIAEVCKRDKEGQSAIGQVFVSRGVTEDSHATSTLSWGEGIPKTRKGKKVVCFDGCMQVPTRERGTKFHAHFTIAGNH